MHSATECNSQRDWVHIGAIPLKNFPSRDYEKARPSAGLSQKSGATKLEHSGSWQWTFLEALVKWAKTQTQELSLKAGAFARRRRFLKSYHSPIPHTPVLIIIWWNAKKNLYNMSINECIGLMNMLFKLVSPLNQIVTHVWVYFWANYGINWLVISFNIAAM